MKHLPKWCITSIVCFAADPFFLQEIQKVQPKGPYLIGGYSFGATVAFEMALQLQKSDSSSVKHVILLDGSHSFVAAFTKTMKNTYTVDSAASADKIAVQRQDAFEVALCALFISQFIKTQQKQVWIVKTLYRNWSVVVCFVWCFVCH